jgi:hypothetical protein
MSIWLCYLIAVVMLLVLAAVQFVTFVPRDDGVNPRNAVTAVAGVISIVAGVCGWVLGRLPKNHWLHRSKCVNAVCCIIGFGIVWFFLFGVMF